MVNKSVCVCMFVSVYIYVYVCINIYIYIYVYVFYTVYKDGDESVVHFSGVIKVLPYQVLLLHFISRK